MPDYQSKPSATQRAAIEELLKRHRSSQGKPGATRQVPTDAEIAQIPEVVGPGAKQQASMDSMLLRGMEAGAVTREDAESREWLNPDTFTDTEPMGPADVAAVKAMGPSEMPPERQAAGKPKSTAWEGKGGWKYRYFDSDGGIPYIMVTNPKTGNTVRVTEGTRGPKGDYIFESILAERDDMGAEPAVAAKPKSTKAGEPFDLSWASKNPRGSDAEVALTAEPLSSRTPLADKALPMPKTAEDPFGPQDAEILAAFKGLSPDEVSDALNRMEATPAERAQVLRTLGMA